MKRFGRYDNDFNNLFECYSKVSPGLIVERELPSATREVLSDTIGGTSFNGLKKSQTNRLSGPIQTYNQSF